MNYGSSTLPRFFSFIANPTLLLLTFLCTCVSAPLAAQTISRDSVRLELGHMIWAMEIYHPNAYHYADSTEIAAVREELVAELDERVTPMDAYRAYNQLACAFGDGHTRVYAYKIQRERKANGRYFPFSVDVRGEELFLRADYRLNADADLTGRRITSINGRAAATLIAEMSRHASRETAALDRILLGNDFDHYLWLTYGWEDFNMTVDGQPVSVAGVDHETLVAGFPERQTRPVIDAQILPDGTAYLYVGHFMSSLKDYKRGFARAFAKFREAGAERLVLDLRGHGGGDSRVGEELARYIATTPFRSFNSWTWKATPAFKESFKNTYLPGPLKYALPVLKNFHPHLRAIYRAEDHAEALVEFKPRKPYGPAKHFGGEVTLLMDENTFSAGTCFAAMFKDYNMGTIYGRESGNLANFHADTMTGLRLSGGASLKISSSYLVRPSGDDTARPVQPDVYVSADEDALEVALLAR